ncbi:hypothetical protein [Azonexus sp.]|uniref:hypothetical protein n=1 Tax=Azonexus sp. TaxID=1872668 RepID=UPI0039E51B14
MALLEEKTARQCTPLLSFKEICAAQQNFTINQIAAPLKNVYCAHKFIVHRTKCPQGENQRRTTALTLGRQRKGETP